MTTSNEAVHITTLDDLNYTQREQVEAHRVTWRRIARIHKWETEQLFVTVWIEGDNVIDSVSYRGLDRDVFHVLPARERITL